MILIFKAKISKVKSFSEFCGNLGKYRLPHLSDAFGLIDCLLNSSSSCTLIMFKLLAMRSGRRAQVGNASNWFSAAAARTTRTGQPGLRTAWHATSRNNNQRVATLRQSFCCCRFYPLPLCSLTQSTKRQWSITLRLMTNEVETAQQGAGSRGEGVGVGECACKWFNTYGGNWQWSR